MTVELRLHRKPEAFSSEAMSARNMERSSQAPQARNVALRAKTTPREHVGVASRTCWRRLANMLASPDSRTRQGTKCVHSTSPDSKVSRDSRIKRHKAGI